MEIKVFKFTGVLLLTTKFLRGYFHTLSDLMGDETVPISVRLPRELAEALAEAVKNGKAVSESDYLRDAIRKKMREDGLI
jgi:hypothetical protein